MTRRAEPATPTREGQDFFAEAEAGREGDAGGALWRYQGLRSAENGQRRLWNSLPLALAGAHQRDNCAVAPAALELLRDRGWPLSEEQVRHGLAVLRWPGRLEHFWRDHEGTVLTVAPASVRAAGFRRYPLDGAHNPDGVESLCHHLRETASSRARLILVWASMVDKALALTLPPVASLADRILLTRPQSERAAVPSILMALLAPPERARASTLNTVAEALQAAVAAAEAEDLICVAGSLYLVGEAREILRGGLGPMSPLRDDEVFGSPDKARIKAERAEARRLRATAWWQRRIGQGICHYCGHKVGREALTMDHVVPLSRGGRSSKGNLVPCCKECNTAKKTRLPLEWEPDKE